MRPLDVGLDHAGLAIKDLDAARQAFERLGFHLSARSIHAGAVTPGGPVIPWGSGNHCAMFGSGYLELLGLIDPALHSTAKHMVAKYEGWHIVAMDCASADQAYAQLQAAGVPAPAPMTLERDATFGLHDDLVRRARFRNIYLDSQAYPEARFIVIEQCTRDVLWQPHLLAHPNGATALAGVYFCPADLHACIERFARMLGKPAQRGDAYEFKLRHGAFWLLSEQSLRRHCPVLDGVVHGVAAAAIAVESLPALQDYLAARGVKTYHAPAMGDGRPSIWVHPSDANHAALQFIESQ